MTPRTRPASRRRTWTGSRLKTRPRSPGPSANGRSRRPARKGNGRQGRAHQGGPRAFNRPTSSFATRSGPGPASISFGITSRTCSFSTCSRATPNITPMARHAGGTTAMAFVDSCVEKLVNAVKDGGLADRTTFLIVSDHGFKAYKSQIRANVALQQAGLGDKAYVLPEGGTAFVYVEPEDAPDSTRPPGADRRRRHRPHRRRRGFPALGLPTPEKDPQFGQLLLRPRTAIRSPAQPAAPSPPRPRSTGGSHGYLASRVRT